MPSKLRLGLSLSSIKRIFADVAPVTDDPLLTQDGIFIALNQNPNQLLILNQDFEIIGDRIVSENVEGLLTQDGETLITQKQFR